MNSTAKGLQGLYWGRAPSNKTRTHAQFIYVFPGKNRSIVFRGRQDRLRRIAAVVLYIRGPWVVGPERGVQCIWKRELVEGNNLRI